ncbi:MAG TPA: (Fe-S)-binding protein [Acidimicrobiia bacterium]|nr:(Fe-S)-binding protein [Acidimicrobiia bacterium]
MATWVTDFAPTTAELNSCVACGLCLPHCPTFRLTGLESASPRGRIAAMKAVAEGVIELDSDFEEAMTFCLNCRACEAVCPSMVPFGRAMEGARAEIAVQRPTAQRRIRHWLLGRFLGNRGLVGLATDGLRLIQRLRIDGMVPGRFGKGLRGLRPLKSFLSSNSNGSGPVIGLLVGCVMGKWFSGVNAAAVTLLTRAGYRVVVPQAQTCCGALVVHDGGIEEGRRLAAINVRAFDRLDHVVATAAGCSAHLKSYGKVLSGGSRVASNAADITEVVAELISVGKLPTLGTDLGAVVLHHPCHLRYAQRLTEPPRQILAAAGYRIIEADPEGLCCGAAGIYSLLRPATSQVLGERLASLIDGRSEIVATSNPGCEMQIRSYLDRGYRIAHPIELYLEAIRSLEVSPAHG